MKRQLTALIGMTALTAVVGLSAAPPPAESASAPAAVSAKNDEQPYRTLITTAVQQSDPNATPEDIDDIIAALGDIGTIIAGVDPADVTRVAQGIAEASAAIAEFQATGNPDAARRVLCGSGNAAAGSMSILSDVVRLYEASANLPQIPEILDQLDPRTPQGAALFESLPDFAKTEQTKAALISLSDFGRAMNTIDKQKVIGLAKDWGEAAAKCDISTLLALPGLMVRSYEMAREVLDILSNANTGDMSAILSRT